MLVKTSRRILLMIVGVNRFWSKMIADDFAFFHGLNEQKEGNTASIKEPRGIIAGLMLVRFSANEGAEKRNNRK